MTYGNRSTVTEFIFVGLSENKHIQVLLFIIILASYVFTLLGNISILLIIQMDHHLHSPMYFFLGSLSMLDVLYSSTTTPKMLVDMFSEKKTISYYGCVAQLVFYPGFGSTEMILLAVMAYDRYVAICNPLMYSLTVTKTFCVCWLTVSFIGGFLQSLIHVGCFIRLSFCGPNTVDHFLCDYPVLLKLSCTDITINDLVRLICASLMMLISLLIVIISYGLILSAVLRIRTAAGRHRAFSTCGSHFTCVSIFYGTVLFTELRPNSATSQEHDKVLAVFSTILISMLNPLIYSLRNEEVKTALRKLLNRTMCLKWRIKNCSIVVRP